MSTAIADARSEAVYAFLLQLQRDLTSSFGGEFHRHEWTRPASAESMEGRGITAVQENGPIMERGGVALSDVRGNKLPPAATLRNPHLAGREWRAMGVSVVMHPRNAHAPTAHANVRFFNSGDTWWFGGGFDLTPYLPYEEDVIAWHAAARDACAPYGKTLYAQTRATCDEYFYLKHRGESRGIGGIFYDDLNEETPELGMPWEQCFGFMQAVGNGFRDVYKTIVDRRQGISWTSAQREYQLHRRGRYVEFNLVFDRGTHFGLQSGGRTNSILMSMPPEVRWAYESPSAELDSQLLPYLTTLRGKDWLA